MQTIPFRAVGTHDVQLAAQGHPPGWRSPPGGDYDLVVVGGGPGGLVAALTAAGAGHRVAVVERHLTGGTCVNYGCTPSKALIACARAAHRAAHLGPTFGYRLPGPPEVDFAAVMERVRAMRVNSSKFDAVPAVAAAGVDVYLGDARFAAEDAVEVDGRRLRFRAAVIATGSRAGVPDADGLAEVGFLTNETVFGLTERPRRLAVVGAGPLGCELAQAFRHLGCEVDLISAGDRLLPKDDPDASGVIRRRFEREGIRLHLGAALRRVERTGDAKRLTLDDRRTIDCDELLLGVGRVPNVEGLGLEAAGVRTTPHGVEVDQHLRTSNRNIYAVGDCCSRYKFTHAAMAMGQLAARNALDGAGRAVSSVAIPWCTYTDPEVAHVGLTPQEADDQGIAIDTHRLDLTMVERAVIEAQAEGFAAISTRQGTGRIVGATLVSAHAGETIPLLTAFVQHELPLEALAEVVHCYPTQAEVLKRIADNYLKAAQAAKV